MMNSLPLLFLDFDGVICDSLDECIISSLYAYYSLLTKTKLTSLPRDYKREFNRLRPYVRNGEDYLVIQEILKNHITITGQDHFDTLLSQHSRELPFYKELFYKARNYFIEKDPGFWYSLNRIYPHILPSLGKICTSREVYILSTKRADFISTILEKNGIRIPGERILVAWNIDKCDLISSLLDKHHYQHALFVDDQIDHLVKNTDSRITPCLAAWGYIQREWLVRDVTIIDKKEMAETMRRYEEPRTD
jgi:phosphoglycolate phosphatase-like HAD superfamily hydrolase